MTVLETHLILTIILEFNTVLTFQQLKKLQHKLICQDLRAALGGRDVK